MFREIIVTFLLFIMVNATIYSSFAQYKGVEVTIVMIEEEENTSQDKSSKLDENLYEYTFNSHKNVVFSLSKNNEWNQQKCYYSLHHKDSGIKPPPDNPPEV